MRTHVVLLLVTLATAVAGTATCNFTLYPGNDWQTTLQAVLNTGGPTHVICIAPGTHTGCAGGVKPLDGSTVTVVGLNNATGDPPTLDCNYTGRAFHVDYADNRLYIYNLNFDRTSATSNGGVARVDSGGFISLQYVRATRTSNVAVVYAASGAVANVTDCEFRNNGGPAVFGSVLYMTLSSTLYATRASFLGNTAAKGPVYAVANSRMYIHDCNFTENVSDNNGASTYFISSYGNISSTIFESNTAGASGGGVYAETSVLNLQDVTFNKNTASASGGAIYTTTTEITVTRANFNENSATYSGGAMQSGNTAVVSVSGSTFSNNYAGNNGGSVGITSATANVSSVTIHNSGAGKAGGGLYSTSHLSLTNSSIENCKAGLTGSYSGGGLFHAYASANVSDCTFSNNTASVYGGGLYFLDVGEVSVSGASITMNSAAAGGGVYTHSGWVEMTNCTVSENEADHGGAVRLVNDASVAMNTCTLTFNSVSGNGGALSTYDTASATVTNCTLDSNTATTSGGAVAAEGDSEVNITHSNLCGNAVGVYGGAVFVDSTSAVTVGHSVVCDNSATYRGGALYARGDTVVVFSSVSAVHNVAPQHGGGALFVDSQAHVSATESNFTCNSMLGSTQIACSSGELVDSAAGATVCGTAVLRLLDNSSVIAANYYSDYMAAIPCGRPTNAQKDAAVYDVATAVNATLTGYVPVDRSYNPTCLAETTVCVAYCLNGGECTEASCNPTCDCSGAPASVGYPLGLRCNATECGDSVVVGNETCDDGNRVNNDTCNNNCVPNYCGNSQVEAVLGEECDDGNSVDDDACTNDCILNFCGNNRTEVSIGEECDDGNSVDDDACTNDCILNFCGNNRTEVSIGEECDDGNTVDDDACTNDCILNFCGNNRTEVLIGEECDDGNSVDGDGCHNNCTVNVNWPPSTGGPTASTDTVGSGLPSTGTAPGNTTTDAPTSTTSPPDELCGNGVVDAGEDCDPEDADSGPCTGDCRVDADEVAATRRKTGVIVASTVSSVIIVALVLGFLLLIVRKQSEQAVEPQPMAQALNITVAVNDDSVVVKTMAVEEASEVAVSASGGAGIHEVGLEHKDGSGGSVSSGVPLMERRNVRSPPDIESDTSS